MGNIRRKIDLDQIEPIDFSVIQNTPTTLSGYGITDAFTKTESDARYVLQSGGGYSAIDIGPLTGPTVVSEINVDEFGNTTNISTRNITPANIGAQPAGAYELNTNKSTDVNLGLSDVLYPTQRAVKIYVDSSQTLQKVTDNGNTTTNSVIVSGITNNSSYTQNASGWTMNGRTWILNFPNNTHSSTSFRIQNTSSPNPGGMQMTERGSTIIRARGDSVTDYYILRLQGSANSQATIFDVGQHGLTQIGLTADIPATGLLRVGGTVSHDDATVDEQSMTLGQYRDDDIVVTGLKHFRSGANETVTLNTSFEYPDGAGETFNLRLFNEGTENSVMWYLRQNHNDNREDYVMGFEHGVTIVGTNRPSVTIIDDIDTELANNVGDPNYRYPISLYAVRDTMVEGRGYFGKDNFSNTAFLTANDTLFSEGTIYAKAGIRTADPDNPATVFDHTTWLLGDATADVQTDSTHTIRVSIDGVLYDIMAVAV